MNRLKNKVALITGGNSGVGRTCAKLFAEEGAIVVITARRRENLDAVAAEIQATGGQALAVQTDISTPEDPDHLASFVLEKFGRIDILINNAGILEEGLKPIDRFSDEDLDRILNTNQKGTMRCIRAVSKHMQPGSSIVNVASVAGIKGCGGAAYVASKAAIIGITTHTALRFQSDGIRSNAVCPGTILTPMVKNMDAESLDEDMVAAMTQHSNVEAPVCEPIDVANILLFLASDESRAITGQTIQCDFGSFL